jgi:hypothetical protein
VNRAETLRAAEELSKSPAAKWIGNKLIENGAKVLQKCMRCGAEEVLEMPKAATTAFQRGARGDSLASQVPPDFDSKLYAWKKAFQLAHESCSESGAA